MSEEQLSNIYAKRAAVAENAKLHDQGSAGKVHGQDGTSKVDPVKPRAKKKRSEVEQQMSTVLVREDADWVLLATRLISDWLADLRIASAALDAAGQHGSAMRIRNHYESVAAFNEDIVANRDPGFILERLDDLRGILKQSPGNQRSPRPTPKK